jgi:hypothetical protein
MAGQGNLQAYTGEGKSVVVYNTYADGRRIHFDVFVPTDKKRTSQVPKEMDDKAVEYAKEFLQLIGKPTDKVQVNMCERCHIDNTDLYRGQLWKLPGKDILIWPMEGCPQPSE